MRRALVASAIALATLIGFAVAPALSDFGEQKPPEPPASEATSEPVPPPVPGEPRAEIARAFDVATDVRPPAGACPESWRYFDNTVLHAGICYPPGWGFADHRSSERARTLRSTSLNEVHLLSEPAFPMTEGSSPFDAVTQRGAIHLEIGALDPGARFTTACSPTARTLVGPLSLLWCEDTSADGLMRRLVVVAPLRRTPLQTHEVAPASGTRLIVIARMRALDATKGVSTAWQIVRTLRPY